MLQDHPWLTSEFVSPGGLGRFSVHSYVRKSFGRRIVIDTCYGNGKVRRYSQTGNSLDLPFLADLQRAGYPVGAIDTVVCTHLHVLERFRIARGGGLGRVADACTWLRAPL